MSSVQSPGSGEERTQHPYVTDRVRLPTWNKGFKLSAQKPARGPDGGQQCHAGGEVRQAPRGGWMLTRRLPRLHADTNLLTPT